MVLPAEFHLLVVVGQAVESGSLAGLVVAVVAVV